MPAKEVIISFFKSSFQLLELIIGPIKKPLQQKLSSIVKMKLRNRVAQVQGEKIAMRRFANDIVLLAKVEEDLEVILNTIENVL